jgi:hypothetical protein
MKCPRCDTEVPGDASFCYACGAHLEAAPRRELRGSQVRARAALAETVPFEPSPLPGPSAPAPPEPAPPEESGRWSFSPAAEGRGNEPAAVTGPLLDFERPPGESSSDSTLGLELRLARRRQLVHGLLAVLCAAFLAGAAFFLYVGWQALRGAP